jgi:hypothetical protein
VIENFLLSIQVSSEEITFVHSIMLPLMGEKIVIGTTYLAIP